MIYDVGLTLALPNVPSSEDFLSNKSTEPQNVFHPAVERVN